MRVDLLAGAHELDRLAGDGAHGQCGAAAAIAVDAGEHDAGERQALIEIAREIDGVLAGQRVGDEQRLMRLGDTRDLRRLGHQRFVDMGAAGGVEHQHVIAAELGCLDRALGDACRVLAFDDGKRGDAGLLAQHPKLLLRRRPPRIERGHQHFLLLAVLQAARDLCRGRGLAGALQADQHHHHGRCRDKVDRLGFGAERAHELVMHDLDDHLARSDGAHHLLAHGLRPHRVGEVAHHVERNVGLEQRAANLAHRFIDVGLVKRAFAGELVEDGAKAIRQGLEHRLSKTKNAPEGASRCRVLTPLAPDLALK